MHSNRFVRCNDQLLYNDTENRIRIRALLVTSVPVLFVKYNVKHKDGEQIVKVLSRNKMFHESSV